MIFLILHLLLRLSELNQWPIRKEFLNRMKRQTPRHTPISLSYIQFWFPVLQSARPGNFSIFQGNHLAKKKKKKNKIIIFSISGVIKVIIFKFTLVAVFHRQRRKLLSLLPSVFRHLQRSPWTIEFRMLRWCCLRINFPNIWKKTRIFSPKMFFLTNLTINCLTWFCRRSIEIPSNGPRWRWGDFRLSPRFFLAPPGGWK